MESSYLNSVYCEGNPLCDQIRLCQAKDIVARYDLDTSGKLLDIATGRGNWALAFKEAGFSDISAMDADDSYKARLIDEGIDFIRHTIEPGTAGRFPWQDETFDVVTCFDFIEHIRCPEVLLTEIKRVLKPNGRCIIVTPDWKREYLIFYDDPTHVQPYTKDSLQKLCRFYGFDVIGCSSFQIMRFFGITRLWRLFPLMFYTGGSIICVCEKDEAMM